MFVCFQGRKIIVPHIVLCALFSFVLCLLVFACLRKQGGGSGFVGLAGLLGLMELVWLVGLVGLLWLVGLAGLMGLTGFVGLGCSFLSSWGFLGSTTYGVYLVHKL